MRTFILVWVGQFISAIGSGLTSFALGVWVYQTTGSATQFALVILFILLPEILLSPFAGALVDRWNRRWIMIVGDLGSGLGTIVIALLLHLDLLNTLHIYVITCLSSMFNIFRLLAYSAATTLLVPKEHFGRASGMVESARATTEMVSPALAGILIGLIQLEGVIIIDVCTFLFAISTLFIVRFPKPEAGAKSGGASTMFTEIKAGWTYIVSRRGLFALLIFFAAANFFRAFFRALITPMILIFSSEAVLGTIMSIGGVGALIGSLVMSVWGGANRKIHSLLGFQFVVGICILLSGLRPSLLLITLAVFGVFFSMPIVRGSSHAIWQRKTTPSMQGRVLSIRVTIAFSSLPVAYLLAGPLADNVFEPLMMNNNFLAKNIGQLIGVGPGRGIGLIFIIMGALISLTTVIAYLYPRLRFVEDEIPDAIA